jgi:hypothetical protein
MCIGVTEYCPSEEMTAFINRADAAMYLSKQNGRNRVSVLFANNAFAPQERPPSEPPPVRSGRVTVS